MYSEIGNKMIVQTIAAYEELTDHIHERLTKGYQRLHRRLSQQEKDELMFIASVPGSETTSPIILKDVTEAYGRYCGLCREQIESTYRNINELSEWQETMNRIMACYDGLPEKEHEILRILYEENTSYKQGLVDAMTRLGITKATVDRRRSRALEDIKKMYDSEMSHITMIRSDASFR